jgi:hypothetical protein
LETARALDPRPAADAPGRGLHSVLLGAPAVSGSVGPPGAPAGRMLERRGGRRESRVFAKCLDRWAEPGHQKQRYAANRLAREGAAERPAREGAAENPAGPGVLKPLDRLGVRSPGQLREAARKPAGAARDVLHAAEPEAVAAVEAARVFRRRHSPMDRNVPRWPDPQAHAQARRCLDLPSAFSRRPDHLTLFIVPSAD